jgi:hypothetical protein
LKPEGGARANSKDNRSKSKDNKKRGDSKDGNYKNKRDNKFQRKKGAPKWKNIEAEVE